MFALIVRRGGGGVGVGERGTDRGSGSSRSKGVHCRPVRRPWYRCGIWVDFVNEARLRDNVLVEHSSVARRACRVAFTGDRTVKMIQQVNPWTKPANDSLGLQVRSSLWFAMVMKARLISSRSGVVLVDARHIPPVVRLHQSDPAERSNR